MTKRWLLVAALAVGGAVTASPDSGVEAARPPCADSNGSRPGGSVYLQEGLAITCAVTPPQRLHLLRSTQARCDFWGGRFTPSSRICWDIDY